MKRLGVGGWLLMATMLVHTTFADDSYLYWMVDETAADGITYDAVAVTAFTGDDVGKGSLLTLYYGNGNAVGGNKASWDSGYSGLPFYASLAGVMGENYSYVVELFLGNELVGQSEALAFATAQSAGNIATTTSAGSLPGLATWSPASFRPVPEPTSALLAFLGLATLALRRGKGLVRGI